MFPGDDLRCIMEAAEPRKYNIVVFGATGFTGQFVVEEIARTVDSEARLKWAVAGRDMSKLQAVLSTASKVTGDCITPVIDN